MTAHVIQRLFFEVEISNASAADALQDRLSQFEKEFLRPLLDDIFDSLSTLSSSSKAYSDIIKFTCDRLELDLGNLSHNQLEYELKTRIPSVLRQALTRELQQSESVSNSSDRVTDKSLSLLEQLEYYLYNGVMHWSAPLAETPDHLLQRCLDSDPQGLRLWLLKEGAKVRRRLVYHFDYLLLYRLAKLLSPKQAEIVRAMIEDLLRIQKRWQVLVVDGKSALSQSSAEIHAIAWQGALAVFLQNEGDASQTAVNKSVLESLAGVIGATRGDLAELLLRRAKLTSGVERLRNALQALVNTSQANIKTPGHKSIDSLDEVGVRVSDPVANQSTALADLLYLLRHGVLPTFGGRLPRQSTDAWISELLKLHKKELLDALHPLAHRLDQLRRLLRFLPRRSLERLILAIAGNHGGFVLTYLLAYDRAVKEGQLPSAAIDVVWPLLLGRLLDLDRGPLNPAEVTGDLSYRVARRLGLSELDLMRCLYAALLNASDSRSQPLIELLTQRIREFSDSTGGNFSDATQVREIPDKRARNEVSPSDPVTSVVYFLRFGNLPDSENSGAAWNLDVAIAKAEQSNAAELRDKLLVVLRDSVALQRLVLNVSEQRLVDITNLISPQESASIAERLVDLREVFEGHISNGSLGAPWSALVYQALLPLLCRNQSREVDPIELNLALVRTIAMQPGWNSHRVLELLKANLPHKELLKPKLELLLGEVISAAETELALPPDTFEVPPNRTQESNGSETSTEPCYVENAGQVLLWPFLERYFASLDMLQEDTFPDIQTASRAAYLIEYLVGGVGDFKEYRLPLNKVLCGLTLDSVLAVPFRVTDDERVLCDELLLALTQHWAPLRNTSIAGLRESFLQREGRLEHTESGWSLTVDGKAYDLLLDQLPWGLSTIRLPWMTEVLHVKWR